MSAATDALRQWAAAERSGDQQELANARAARDAVIAAAPPGASLPVPLYVVVCSDDLNTKYRNRVLLDDPQRQPNPIVLETNVNGATFDAARARAAQFESGGYGACRVGRVVFKDEPGFAS